MTIEGSVEQKTRGAIAVLGQVEFFKNGAPAGAPTHLQSTTYHTGGERHKERAEVKYDREHRDGGRGGHNEARDHRRDSHREARSRSPRAVKEYQSP